MYRASWQESWGESPGVGVWGHWSGVGVLEWDSRVLGWKSCGGSPVVGVLGREFWGGIPGAGVLGQGSWGRGSGAGVLGQGSWGRGHGTEVLGYNIDSFWCKSLFLLFSPTGYQWTNWWTNQPTDILKRGFLLERQTGTKMSLIPIKVADPIGKKIHKKIVFFLAFFSFPASKQASKQARKLFGTSMLNISQIVWEMEISAHFSLCKQASKQERKRECYVEHPC